MGWRIACVLAGSLLLWSCASTVGSHDPPRPEPLQGQRVRFPSVQGPKRTLQVREIRIPTADLNRYPELMETRIGVGLSKILVDTLFDTGRFDLMEAPDQIVTRLGKLWQRTEDGIYVRHEAPEGLPAPEFLIYAKVFDVDACAAMERLVLTRTQLTCSTSIGVQVSITNAAGQVIPGFTHPLSPQGRYVHIRQTFPFGTSQTAFDQSAVGKATVKAVRYAVLRALEMFDQEAW